MPALILWDIDGTMVRSGPATAVAFQRAVQASFGRPIDFGVLNTAGSTDRQILLDALALHGVGPEAVLAGLPAFQAAYEQELEAERASLHAHLVVLPGVKALLDTLAERGAWQSLLTGNMPHAARLKVGAAGLEHRLDFSVGAFGSDHHDRNQLPPIALARASARRGQVVPPAEALIIGDTPRDIACARANGLRVIAVATGRFSREQLADHAPDALFETLADTAVVLAALGA